MINGDILYVHIEEGRTIGEKRNFGSSLARGQIIVSWDDDDWSAPDRIRDQISRMEHSGKSVSSYHSMLFSDGDRWWKYKGSPTANLGTSLCYRKDWWESHKFSSKQVGEDSDFIHEAVRHKQHIAADAGELMIASIHRANTSPRSLSGNNWTRIEKPEGLQWAFQ